MAAQLPPVSSSSQDQTGLSFTEIVIQIDVSLRKFNHGISTYTSRLPTQLPAPPPPKPMLVAERAI